MTKYSRYQDYVIKDGVIIGEFEEMYQDFNDPWEQTTKEKSALEKKIALEIICEKGFKRVVEFGCGLGDYTAQLNHAAGSALGIDISETAIEKANARQPDTEFVVGDILDFDLLRNYQSDCIVFAEITWYVLEKLNIFKEHISSELGGQGVGFIHLLMTYPPDEQKYGKEYFSDLNGIMKYWDIIEFEAWGEFSKKEYNGGKRTMVSGMIR